MHQPNGPSGPARSLRSIAPRPRVVITMDCPDEACDGRPRFDQGVRAGRMRATCPTCGATFSLRDGDLERVP